MDILSILRWVMLGIAIAIFWGMLSIIFEVLLFGKKKADWAWIPWWFCDVVAPIGGIATFLFLYLSLIRR